MNNRVVLIQKPGADTGKRLATVCVPCEMEGDRPGVQTKRRRRSEIRKADDSLGGVWGCIRLALVIFTISTAISKGGNPNMKKFLSLVLVLVRTMSLVTVSAGA